MRVSNLILSLILASTSACAARAGMAPSDYAKTYDDAAMGAVDASFAGPMQEPSVGGMKANITVERPPNAIFGVPATPPVGAEPAEVEPVIDGLETIGADSVDQMLIFTGQLALRVEFSHTAKSIDAAVGLAVSAGGYVAQMTDTSLTLRVPSKRFRKVMTQLEELGEVQSRGVQALDVSEEFNDLEVQLANLQATRARIEKLLGQTKDLTQILTIEKELQRVTSEIDRLQGRMRLLSSQAAFSTISLAFSERPEDREIKIATDELPPPTAPRTLSTSATWIHGVGVHGLMNFNN